MADKLGRINVCISNAKHQRMLVELMKRKKLPYYTEVVGKALELMYQTQNGEGRSERE